MGVLSKYATILSNMLSDGNLNSKGKLSSSEIMVPFNKIITAKSIKQVYCITRLGKHADKYVLKYAILDKMNKIFGDKALTSFYEYSAKIPENLDTADFRRRAAMVIAEYEEVLKLYESMSVSERERGKRFPLGNNSYIKLDKAVLRDREYRADSYKRLLNSIDNEEVWAYDYLFVILTTKDQEICQRYKDELESLSMRLDISIMQLQTNLQEFLTNYTFLGSISNQDVMLGVNANLVSTKDVARNNINQAVGVSKEYEIFNGFIYENKAAYYLNFKDMDSAKNIMVLLKTGLGKTVYVKNNVLFHIKSGDHISIMDYKGGEYGSIEEYANTLSIDFSGKNPQAVNTLTLISNCEEYDIKTLKYFADRSISKTVEFIQLLSGIEERDGNVRDIIGLLRESIRNIYVRNYGVDLDNPRTYFKAKEVQYEDILSSLDIILGYRSNTEEQKQLLIKIKNRVYPYFSREGALNYMLQNYVTIEEILESQVVIFNFNKNIESESKFDMNDEFRIFFMSYLNGIKSYYRKTQGKFTVLIYEELQRAKQSKAITRLLNQDTTGGRSSNKIIYLIANSTSFFASSSDSQIRDDILSIRSSISTYILGRMNQVDYEFLRDNMELGETLQNLKRIINDIKMERVIAIKHRGLNLLVDFNLASDTEVGDNLIKLPYFASADKE